MPIPITMPRLSDTMESGTIIKWNIKEGDKVSSGDVIADIETDKATMEMTAYDDGTVASIAVPVGKAVGIGTVIAVLASAGEDPKEVAKSSSNGQTAQRKSAPEAKPVAKTTTQTQSDTNVVDVAPIGAVTERVHAAGDDRVRVSPVARRLAEEHRINLSAIEGSGPGGRIIKRDVMKAIDAAGETAAAVPPSAMQERSIAPSKPVEVAATRVPMMTHSSGAPGLEARSIQLSSMRQTIARRLVESKSTIPHYQVSLTFNMDPLLELRSTLNQQLESQSVKLSINDFLVKGCSLAMYQHPEFNSSWAGDHIEIHGEINIGIAIAMPSERGGGLLVATIRNADQKSLRVISYESKMLSEKARTRGLTIQEMSDSTFTISNMGMFGVDEFNAIINPPNVAILAVGAAIKKPVVRNNQIVVGHEMTATLSSDHRVIDGAMAAQYLNTLKGLIENPATLLV